MAALVERREKITRRRPGNKATKLSIQPQEPWAVSSGDHLIQFFFGGGEVHADQKRNKSCHQKWQMQRLRWGGGGRKKIWAMPDTQHWLHSQNRTTIRRKPKQFFRLRKIQEPVSLVQPPKRSRHQANKEKMQGCLVSFNPGGLKSETYLENYAYQSLYRPNGEVHRPNGEVSGALANLREDRGPQHSEILKDPARFPERKLRECTAT